MPPKYPHTRAALTTTTRTGVIMANSRVNQTQEEINGQFQPSQEQATTLLAKLNALLELGLSSDLEMQTRASLHSYLWVLSDLVEQLETVMG